MNLSLLVMLYYFFSLEISELSILSIDSSSMEVLVDGFIDNRGFAGTMSPSTYFIQYQWLSFGTLAFPALTLAANANTDFSIRTKLEVTAQNGLTRFIADLLLEDNIDIELHSVTNISALGMTFRNIDVSKTVSLGGFGNFSNPAIRVQNITVIGGFSTGLQLAIESEFINSGSISLTNVGRLNLTLIYEGVEVGSVESDHDVALLSGLNKVNFTGILQRTATNEAQIGMIVSNYASGLTSRIELHGNSATTNYSLILPAMAALTAELDLEG
jgi:hypothetical protein